MLTALLLFGRWEGALPHLKYLVCNSNWTTRALMGLQIISRGSYRSLEDGEYADTEQGETDKLVVLKR